MRTFTVKTNAPIVIGRQGENEAQKIVWENIISSWKALYGDGIFQLFAIRAEDNLPYPIVTEESGDNIVWTVNNADTAQVGKGKCELSFYVNDVLAKSQSWTTIVGTSITGDGSVDPPEPYEDWVERVLKAAAEAQAAQKAAEEAQGKAEQAESDAEQYAVNAKQSADNASVSESNAKISETNAANSASAAAATAANAESAEAGAKAAQIAAEAAQSDAEAAAAGATEKATAAAGSADDCEAAQQDIQDSIDGVAQESTAQTITGYISEILTLLNEIAAKPSGINGFSFNLGDNDEVIISYTDPDDETITDSVILPTNITGAAIVDAYKGIAAALAEIAGKETT